MPTVPAPFYISSTRSIIAGATFMGLGDSITAGLQTTSNSYRDLLTAAHPGLQQIGSVSKNGYQMEGHPGFTSADILSNISTWYALNPAKIVFLHIGTNDPISPHTITASQTASNIQSICTTIHGMNAAALILVASPIINSTTPYDIYNATYLAQSAATLPLLSGLSYVTVVAMPTNMPASAFQDGEHPTDAPGTGYPVYFYPPLDAALVAAGY